MTEAQHCSDIRTRFPELAEDEEELPNAFFKSLPPDTITCLSNNEDLVLQHVTPNGEVRASGPLVVGWKVVYRTFIFDTAQGWDQHALPTKDPLLAEPDPLPP